MLNSHPYPLPAALALSGQGWSLIPVFGDTLPGSEKQAAIKWKDYQRRRASDSEITGWLSRGWQPAIVTGRVSGLVVVDFDASALADGFRREYPHIAASMLWVRTRRGWHGYLGVSRHGDAIPSMTAPGIDMQADGRYVVALLASVVGSEYAPEDRHNVLLKIARQQPLLSPIAGGLAAVQAFMAARSGAAEPLPEPEQPAADERLSPVAAQSIYLTLAGRGRNNALFMAARLMHDHFWRTDDADAALLSSFIDAARPGESAAAREREGRATIASAFNRKRRPVRPIRFRQIPNVIREHMNKTGATAALRVLDALRDSGIAGGATVNQKLVYRLARERGIGGYSVRAFFDWLTGPRIEKSSIDELVIVEDIKAGFMNTGTPAPSEPPRYPAGCNRLRPEPQEQNEFCSGVQNRRKIISRKKGRPEYAYTVPADSAIADRYGLTFHKASDSLTRADFKSVRTYRAAIHRELVIRRPGQHYSAELAARVGKSRQTMAIYNKIAGVKSQATYNDVLLKWNNLGMVPDWNYIDESRIYTNQDGKTYLAGIFLESNTKRFPAKREIAVNEMKQGRRVVLKFQTASYYWHKSQPERAPVEARQPAPAANLPNIEQYKLWSDVAPLPVERPPAPLQDAPGNAPRRKLRPAARRENHFDDTKRLPTHNKRHYRQLLNNTYHELLSIKIHETIPAISIQTARRMVELCRAHDIHRALALVQRRTPADVGAYFATIIEYPRLVRQQKQQARARRDYRLSLKAKRVSDEGSA